MKDEHETFFGKSISGLSVEWFDALDEAEEIALLGYVMMELARKLDLTPASVSYAVQRGEKATKERDYQLESYVI